MGIKLAWTGLTVFHVLPLLVPPLAAGIAGAVIMGIGCVLLWLDK
jgi:hypothetical protein